MPKIEFKRKVFENLLIKKLTDIEIEQALQSAKAEIDEIDQEILKIELNDTNRPDLWTAAGLARCVNLYLFKKEYNYPFFSKESAGEIIVDEKLKEIRPYIAGFGARGKNIDEPLLLELIQNQEKFAGNFGKNRKDIAIGIYNLSKIKFPVYYKAYKPDGIKFVPLGFEEQMNLSEILKKHPKGIEFGDIIKKYEYYPVIVDSDENVLSFPPIINSRYSGEVQVGDSNLFIEMTGWNLENLILISNIFAVDLYDRGFEILPVKVKFPYKVNGSYEWKIPFDFNETEEVELKEFEKILGEKPSIEEIKENLLKTGYKDIKINGEKVIVRIPPYRKDIMHPVDVIEDYAIGRGYNNFEPVLPAEFTVGELSEKELIGDKVRLIMIGMEFQEVMSNILDSKENTYYRMNIPEGSAVEIKNPMTESYSLLRMSIIPSLLAVEARSSKSDYPHKLFEVGEVAVKDEKANYGSRTVLKLGVLLSHPQSNFSEMKGYLKAIMFHLGMDNFNLKESEKPFIIKGRCGDIIYNNKRIGYIGEISPEVLEKWDINMPVTVMEIEIFTQPESL